MRLLFSILAILFGLQLVAQNTSATSQQYPARPSVPSAIIVKSDGTKYYRAYDDSLSCGMLQGRAIDPTAPTSGQSLAWNGSAWIPTTISGGGGGITSLNGLTPSSQTFVAGTSGTDFAIVSSGTAHNFNIPTASVSARGLLSSADYTSFTGKIGGSGTANQVAWFNGTGSITSNTGFRYDGSNVGIGIAPTSRLHVYQPTEVSTMFETNGQFAYAQFKGAGGTGLLFYDATSDAFCIDCGSSIGAGKKLHVHGGMTIGTALQGTTPPANSLLLQGNLGLGGITNPTSPLHVGASSNVAIFEGSVFADHVIFRNSAGSGIGLFFDESGGSAVDRRLWYNQGTFLLGGGGSGAASGKIAHLHGGVAIGTSNTAANIPDGLAVQGNVAVGATSVTSGVELDVTGDIRASSLLTGANRLVYANASGVLVASSTDPATLTNSFVQGGNSFGTAATLGTNDANALNIETNGTTRTNYTSGGSVLHTIPTNQTHTFNASTSTALSNTIIATQGPVNSTQSTIFLSGSDAAGAPQFAVAADNTSIQIGATANKPFHIITNGVYRGRTNADGRFIDGGSAASTPFANTMRTIYTPATSGYVALALAPYENGADQAQYITFNTPGGIERGRVHYNSDLIFEGSGNVYFKANGTTNSAYLQAGSHQFAANGAGYFRLPGLTADPVSPPVGSIWNRSDLGRLFLTDETSTTNTVMTLEKDIQGTAISVVATTHTTGGYDLYTTYNANSNSITATMGASMYDGRTYTIRANNNGTNSVTLNADTGNGIAFVLDGTSGTVTTYTMSTAEIIRATRYGNTIILDK
jgi:hypothetical protein